LTLNAHQENTFVWAPGRDISLFLSRYRQAPAGEAGGLRQEKTVPEAVPAESGEFERGRP
jgi:hypothetical protein